MGGLGSPCMGSERGLWDFGLFSLFDLDQELEWPPLTPHHDILPQYKLQRYGRTNHGIKPLNHEFK